MNMVKKIIALITVILLIIRLFVINVSASFAAPFMVEETLKLLFIEALGASGSYNMDDLESWELEDLENEFKIQMNTNPNFIPKKSLPYLVFPNVDDIPGTPENVEKVQSGIVNLRKQNDDVIADWFNNIVENGSDLYDFINPTYNIPIDMQGMGGAYRIPYDYGNGQGRVDSYRVYLFDYAEVSEKSDGVYYTLVNAHEYVYRLDGTLWYENPYISNRTFSGLKSGEERYGDWRYADGTKLDTDDEAIPVIGEADGTQVTPDMLNPDGTVTIDGTTYSPSDYIDFEKFKDNAIIDLLNEILKAIENAPVVSDQDKPLGDVDEIEVTVPEELSDFTIPTGIVSVFPFCLPWDFVRGIKTLLAKPEVPVFKTEIDLTDFCGFDLGVIPLEISFEKWEPAVIIVRWFFLLLFIISLIMLTPKICKGAG